jgi:hypothetical protein
MCLLHG